MSVIPGDKTVLETKKYVFCYFDVLGTTEKLKENKEKVFTDIWGICSLLNQFKGDEPIKIKTFSDNFLVALECNDENKYDKLNVLANLIGRVYANCLMIFGCMLRGIFTYGDLHIDENFALGNALVEAYKIESTACVFPRIIFDTNVFKFKKYNKISDFKLDFLDHDFKVSLNPLSCTSNDELKFLLNNTIRNLEEFKHSKQYKDNTSVYIKVDYLQNYIFEFLASKGLITFFPRKPFGNNFK